MKRWKKIAVSVAAILVVAAISLWLIARRQTIPSFSPVNLAQHINGHLYRSWLDFWTWGRSVSPKDTNSVVAWTGESPATRRRGFGVRLCRTSFLNPQPGKDRVD